MIVKSGRPVVLRQAVATDAEAIAAVLRASSSSHARMPPLRTAQEDLAFIRDVVLLHQTVTVAEADGTVVGFIAIRGDWIDQLYLDPAWTGHGIGGRLLDAAAARIPVARLFCFQANAGARRFYERHGFRVEASRNAAANEEGLPDLLYARRAR